VRFIFVMLALMFLAVMAIPVIIVATIAIISRVPDMLPWLLIGLGLWLILRGRRSSRRHNAARVEWQSRRARVRPSQPLENAEPAPARQPMPVVQPAQMSVLPIDVEVKVEQIQRKVEVLLGYASQFPVFSHDLYLVRQTASEYLPRTIDAYRALSVGGGTQVVTPSGKTAEQELREQIDLLDLKLDEIARDLQRRDLDHLLTNRRFLEERFGHRIA
jgi:hypothetical protein